MVEVVEQQQVDGPAENNKEGGQKSDQCKQDEEQLLKEGPAGWYKFKKVEDTTGLSHRQKNIQETYATCQKAFDNWENMEPIEVTEELADGYELECRSDGPITISRVKAKGLTLENYKEFRKNVLENTPKCSNRMSIKQIGREEGHDVMMIYVDLPPIVSCRVLYLS